jgi:hypothetical protein
MAEEDNINDNLPIFNDNFEDIILGNPQANVRDFIVYNYRNTVYETGGNVVYNNFQGQTQFNTAKTTYNTQQGMDIVVGGGIVAVDSGANVYAQGNITTPLTLFAKQGTFSETVTADSVIAAYGQFETVAAPFKLFDIPHPQKEGMRLRHGSLEGPELGVYVRGKSSTNEIILPKYWEALVDENTITVQLTATTDKQLLFVSSVNVKNIVVGGDTSIPYYFMIMAERKDVPKLDIEKYA